MLFKALETVTPAYQRVANSCVADQVAGMHLYLMTMQGFKNCATTTGMSGVAATFCISSYLSREACKFGAREERKNGAPCCGFCPGACFPEMVSCVLLEINQPAAPPNTIPPTTVAMMRIT